VIAGAAAGAALSVAYYPYNSLLGGPSEVCEGRIHWRDLWSRQRGSRWSARTTYLLGEEGKGKGVLRT
jgi:hypothetical protein